MEIVKETKEFTIIKKRSGRYGVQTPNKKWINGDDKTKILVDAGLIEVKVKQPEPEETPAEEAPAEETPAEETPAE